MIGSFWNLCRACPSMPVDKQLHSEYRSTYRWHEFTGDSRPEVVRRAPVLKQFGPANEPPLPRRKKCPELAYKSHELIFGFEQTSDSRNKDVANRARSEERRTPSRRSKSEGPPVVAHGKHFVHVSEIDGIGVEKSTVQPGESNGLFKKTISKMSTEYRLQFVWPNVRKTIEGQSNNILDLPKNSQSMGALISSQTYAMPTVHKSTTSYQKEATLHELEPLVTDVVERKTTKNKNYIQRQITTADNSALPPFSKTFVRDRNSNSITRKENFGFVHQKKEKTQNHTDNEYAVMHVLAEPPTNFVEWYKEVVELRKKAGEYKCRGWGSEIDPTLYTKQKEIWDQVSKRSSLSALSLASSFHRHITKEEKEQENNKKFIPLKPIHKQRIPGQVYTIEHRDEPLQTARHSSIRHHLERTTGADIDESALLPSPIKEKLMPAIPKARESESQRESPKKSTASRHGSPQKGSPQKGSPKKIIKIYGEIHEKDHVTSIIKCNSQQALEVSDAPIVKSPPEPTRVKSPEQIIMKSPDPVNWTVPLDTGKTFTVTQNITDGESYSRPQSEIKASSPCEKPSLAAQSAPPELTEQARAKLETWKTSYLSYQGKTENPNVLPKACLSSCGATESLHHDKPMSRSNLRCLDDHMLETDIPALTDCSNATDVLEKARDRFDCFWGGSKEDNV